MNHVGDFFPHTIDWWLRIVLPVAGLAAIVGMSMLLRRERKQARLIADRSRELERLSSELIRANRMKSEFLANVSHELRTPLNAIVGFIDMLREGVYGELSPRQAAPVERIEASANHLRHLVDQILDLARIAAGKTDVVAQIIDLRPFLLDVITEIEPLVEERGLAAKLNLGPSLPRLTTDPTHLRQILMNLIGNAVKYTAAGSITIYASVSDRPPPASGPDPSSAGTRGEVPGDWVTISVSDTGPGISARDLARVFEEFEQVNAGSRGDSQSRGTGLGLPISRRLARAMGGDVTLESEVGKGSTFILWLPVR